MGLKLNLILGGLLVASISGSVWYIDRLQDNISTLKANAQVLEKEIAEQNARIKQQLEKQQKTQEQINTLTAKNQEAQREVNKLRNTFAKHDLDNLALAKPKLIENIVNKGTKKVKDELIALTNPNQFDKKDEDNNT
jgi:septal ring factor EnvC (AmiA/AmiB activator)|tara:strand:- start:333 stop:743 length:411 start_codon:yes stop_codon:yes gene_type:complete